MPPASTAAFRSWSKDNTGMKLSSDAAVQHLLYEGINNFESLTDFEVLYKFQLFVKKVLIP